MIFACVSFDQLFLSDIAEDERVHFRTGIGIVAVLFLSTLVLCSFQLDKQDFVKDISWSASVGIPVVALNLLCLTTVLKCSWFATHHLLETLASRESSGAADVLFSDRGYRHLRSAFYWPALWGLTTYAQIQGFAVLDAAPSAVETDASNSRWAIPLFCILFMCCILPCILSDMLHMLDNSAPFDTEDVKHSYGV
jgi:hypothetical protein